MEGKTEFVQLTRREIYTAMLSFEEVHDVETSEDQLEDITELLFSTTSQLEGTQMLCKDNLDLFETMSCFEVMDPKMDTRMHRKQVLNLKDAQRGNIIVPTDKLTLAQRQALMEEMLVQFATWQSQSALIGQTLYGCLYTADTKLSREDAVIGPFIDALIYIANCFHHKGMRTMILRDEDINFPPTTDNFNPKSNPFVKPYADLVSQLGKAVQFCDTDLMKAHLSVVRQLTTIAAAFLDPQEPVTSQKTNPAIAAVGKLAKDVELLDFTNKEAEWVDKVFEKNMISAIPYTVNKKQFKKISSEQAKQFYLQMSHDFTQLIQMQTDAKSETGLDLPELIQRLDKFTNGKPASFTRLVYENVVLSDTHLLQVKQFTQYIENYILQTNPFIQKYTKEPVWLDFVQKYELMTRERLVMTLRNPSRQRRQNRRFFNDMQILTNEANYTDESLLRTKNVKVTQSNTTALSLSISMTLEMMIRYLDQAFQLELVRTEELPMHFQQARYVYSMFTLNRKNIIRGQTDDLLKLGLVNLDDLNVEIAAKWKQKRKRMTSLQRHICDQLEFGQAMTDAYQGLYYISVAALIKKGIKPYLWPEVDEQVFGARFSVFQNLPVPRYVDYDAFSGNLQQELTDMDFETLLSEAKIQLTKAQQRIGRIIAVEETQRNVVTFSNDTLTKIQKAMIRNSLVTMKLKSAGEKTISLFVDWTQSLPLFPVIDLKI